MLCCAVFALPVQPVAKIDGEHLVFVSPDEQCFLEEWKLKIVSSIFIFEQRLLIFFYFECSCDLMW